MSVREFCGNQLCISGNGRPGKWLNSNPFIYAIPDF